MNGTHFSQLGSFEEVAFAGCLRARAEERMGEEMIVLMKRSF